MTTVAFATTPSLRAVPRPERKSPEDRNRRRVKVVWALLFVNVLAFSAMPTVIRIPHKVGQGLTQAALAAAFLLALTINRKGLIRPNWFLGLYSLLAVTSLMMSIRFIGLGTTYRGVRLVGFVAVLWLLTPWWRDRGLIILRSQIFFLCLILGSLFLGIVLSPKKAFALNFGTHRLDGAIWPIPAPQVGHYMAELVGLMVVLWMCGMVKRRPALLVIIPALFALLASHTRTAMVGLVAGLLIAALSLFTTKRRVRVAFLATTVVLVAVVLPLSPVLNSWLIRGQTSQQVSNLSGRTEVWPTVLSEPRPDTNKIFGSGLSNDSVNGAANPDANGLPIDGSWIAAFQDQGIVGMIIDAAIFLLLLFMALLRPRGPTRALALFLIVYCLFASFTETGMGLASPYLLDLTIAASLLVPRAYESQRHRVKRAFARFDEYVSSAWSPRRLTQTVPLTVPGDALTGAVGVDGWRGLALMRQAREGTRRLGWGVADQAMSSVSNFAVSIYIARTLGAAEFGAFTLAYVTYSFALNASRGLATDPLLVRFSGTDVPTWRRAVASCTGTAAVVGLIAGAIVLAVGACLQGTARPSFLALGLTLPALLLQDSWRFSFFALGRGFQAFVNDTVWAATLLPVLVLLRMTGHASVFWFVFAWGATAGLAAAVGPLQARVLPKLSATKAWISQHRDLGPRYFAEGTANSALTQLRTYGVGLILGLAAIGYVQAANTLMGPFMVIFFGMGLVLLPEAVRIMNRSPHKLPMFCALASAGMALMGLAWGLILLVGIPRGLGSLLLGNQLWRPTYPLILPLTIAVMGGCVMAGAGTGLHALGAARRSLRAMVVTVFVYVSCCMVGAVTGGAVGTMVGGAIASWVAALLFWWELGVALEESGKLPEGTRWWASLHIPSRRAALATSGGGLPVDGPAAGAPAAD